MRDRPARSASWAWVIFWALRLAAKEAINASVMLHIILFFMKMSMKIFISTQQSRKRKQAKKILIEIIFPKKITKNIFYAV
ncbi:hypothetical protein D3C72_1792910 [compost metagenome]